MRDEAVKLFFVSSFQYPSYIAQFKHGLLMAKIYSKILKKNFLYSIFFTNDAEDLKEVNYIEVNPYQLPLRNFRFISLFYFFWLGWFFVKNRKWRDQQVVIITQESKIAFILLFWKMFFKFLIIYECHGLHSLLTDRFVCRNVNCVIFVTRGTQDEANFRFGKLKASALLPNAVDLSFFERAKKRKNQLRKEINLPANKALVGYFGRFTALGFDKGIKNCLRVLKEIKDKSLLMCFVGGTEDEIRHFKKIADGLGLSDSVILVPYQAEAEKVANYMVAMDILIYLPPPEKFFIKETSPMKLFEYMAAEKPIIVANYPSMREILDEQSAIFVEVDNPNNIAKNIILVLNNKKLSQNLAQNAYRKILNNTWEKRAEKIIFIANNLVQKHLCE